MQTLTTPQAILIGSAMISIGAFFGLKNSASLVAPTANSAPQTPTPSVPAPSLDQLLEQVRQALAKSKPALLKACPTESGKTPDHFQIDFTFNAEGRQIARGFSEDRNNVHPGLGTCLSGAFRAITIPPPGNTVRVDAEFSFP